MENKSHRNIFESDFESFELDDGFLLNVDADLRKYEINIKDRNTEKKFNSTAINKSKTHHEENKVDESKHQFEDLSLFLDDLNESDFFEHNTSRSKKTSLRVTSVVPNNEAKAELPSNISNCCLSPVLFSSSKNKLNKAFSSTPLKADCSSNPEEKKGEKLEQEKEKAKKPEENFQKIPECGFLETDIFDNWDVETDSQKDFITLSQAFKLIEEAESARCSNQKEDLNTSIDLLTGKPVGGDVEEELLAESLPLPNFIENQQKEESSDDYLINSDESNSVGKLPAIQKLNFETKTKTEERNSHFGINFNSDDDDYFDFLTQESLRKPKCVKTLAQLKGFSSDESSESITKKGKYCRIIESDSADDSPDLKFSKRHNKKKIRRPQNFKRNAAKEFIESQAEASDVAEVSSDESEEENYDASFVDEELYLTQNYSANMTAKYLESVKNPNRLDGFKIPPAKPYCPAYVFSQIPEDNSTDYELDSFCVNEVEEEIQTDLSDLEVAERILEMDRKKKKRKRILQQAVKIK